MDPKNIDDVGTGLDGLNVEKYPGRDAEHFRRIIAARKALEGARLELQAAVDAAREAGDSWTMIGAALEVTRQAAFQRFGKVARPAASSLKVARASGTSNVSVKPIRLRARRTRERVM
ncbi:MAG: hypothetical protein ACTHNS_06175 [Marmoricola sp.]